MVPEDENNRSRMSRLILGGEAPLSWEELERVTWDTRVLEARTQLPQLRRRDREPR